jgi:type I restriction enzyme M protein
MSRITQQQLESYLWGAATLLRGTIDAGDYKQFIFPLLFYKRLCDVFDEETLKALRDSGGDEDFAQFPENHRFQIPSEAHWREVRKATRDVGRALQQSMRAIETANQNKLYNIFGDAQWTNKDRLSDSMLRDLVEHFSTLELTVANLPEDELGQGYEFLIKKFADDSGHTAAEFYTNRTVVHLMTEMLDVQPGESVYDPTCGSGGMLLSCVAHLRNRNKEWRNVKLFGQERNLMTSSIARMNCFLHGIEDFRIERGDTLAEPKLVEGDRLMQFDVVLANPPYSIKQWDREAFASDPWGRNLYGTPPQGRADYAFQQHILQSLKTKSGRCAVLWPHGVLFRQEEDEMRRKMIEADLVEAVIGLGPNLFYNASMESCVVICRTSKPKERRGKILFINAVNQVTRERAQSFLTDAHIEKVVATYKAFEGAVGFATAATLDEVRARGHSLKIDLYVQEPVNPTANVGGNGNGLAATLTNWNASCANVRNSLAGLLGSEPPKREPLEVDQNIIASFDRSKWKRVRFGDVVKQMKEQVNPEQDGIERYVAGEHMETENVHIRKWGTVGDGYLGPAFIRGFRKGQVLYGSRRTYLKKVAVAEWNGVTANTTFVLQAVEGKMLQELLPWLMLSERFSKHSVQESKGSTNPYVNYPDIAKFEFDLPPLEQQSRIAKILWELDKVKQAYEQVVQAAVVLRRARMRLAFADGGYPMLTIRETGEVQLGRQRAPKYQSGSFTRPYLRVANVFDGSIDYSDVLAMDFDERDFPVYCLRKGDILLNEGQSRELVGRCAIYDGKLDGCCFQNTLIRYRVGEKLLEDYAFAFLQHCFQTGVFAAISSQTTSIAHLGADRFSNLRIPVPPKREQQRIVEAYTNYKRAEASSAEHASRIATLQKSIMNATLR